MLRTIADLLEALVAEERKKLPEYAEVQHTGIFGAMYEGLTKDFLGRALFERMDLRIASGKIRNSKGIHSKQIDCMVVIGPGEAIPHTGESIYPAEKVVMVVEVKKTLYGAALKESMELFHHFWREVLEVRPLQVDLLEDVWRNLFRKNLPSREQVDDLPFPEQMIYHTLVMESVFPLRVIFGYDGYVDELALRDGMIGYLEKVIEMPTAERLRFNINTFPNLIVCKDSSLVKLDGMPYAGLIDKDGWWWWMGSRRMKPLQILLELLWTRLDYLLKLGPWIFGEDLETETISPLLAAKAEQNGQQAGWSYRILPLSKVVLEAASEREDWHPPNINKAEFELIDRLRMGQSVDLTDKALIAFLEKEGETVASVVTSLNQKMLATVDENKLRLLVDDCMCAVLPDGRFIAGENKSGRIMRYAMKIANEVRGHKGTQAS